MTLTLSAWWLPVLAVPVLLLGERVQRRVAVLGRYSIPVPVVGGLLVSLAVFMLDLSGLVKLRFLTAVDARWWTWLVTPEPEWLGGPEKSVSLPLLIGFFTCIGLNATWAVVRKGSWQVQIFLALATVLAVIQNAVGVGLARLMDQSPLLGLVCGSLSQTGGHGTALGFADTFTKAGLPAASTLGAAAATFGLVCGSLIGGPVAMRLIRRHHLAPAGADPSGDDSPASRAEATLVRIASHEPGILDGIRALAHHGRRTLGHLLMLAVLIKIGAWTGWALQRSGMIFPAYMGSLLAGLLLRNILDFTGRRWIDSRLVDQMGGVLLALFLAMAMMGLNLMELAASALPMLVILAAQIAVSLVFVSWVTFRLMGADYEAAVMAAGHCGFAHGATPNAVANMQSISRRFGPAHRAFIVVPIVGGMFIDITNSLNITWFLNLLKT
jgi:glutamate:Na+ symporter, ESS family